MRALGVHTFFVGFQRGMEQALGKDNVYGSVEGWDRGIRARQVCGAGHIPMDGIAGLAPDLVFSNPPCSRYSSMSTGHFDSDDKSKLVNFCELGTAVDVALQLGARALWWETGPLLWSKGMDMVQDVHRAMESAWGDVTTVVVKMDLRYFGVPQRRPRCHVLHARGLWEPPDEEPSKRWPPTESLRAWLEPRVPHRTRKFRDVNRDEFRREILFRRLFGNFASSQPTMIRADAVHAPTVLSSREFAWQDSEEWWTVEEYAALMCYPVDETCAVADELGPREAKTLLSKSVSPSAALGVWQSVFEPTLRTPGPGGVWRVRTLVPEGETCSVRPESLYPVDLSIASLRPVEEGSR